MTSPNPEETHPPAVETGMSDRAILLHLLSHAEWQTQQTDAMAATIAALEQELDSFRPILNMLKPNGAAPNAISMAQAGRTIRAARRAAARADT